MRLLLDTNIFLEILLGQERAEEAKALLSRTGQHEFFVTDYAVHSVGVLLFRQGLVETFRQFVSDLIRAGVTMLSLRVEELEALAEIAQQFRLDFDDAYQYMAAKNDVLEIVSFDADFDRTDRGRKTPSQILSFPTP